MKLTHEVRDAVHGFIRFDNLEKQVIDSVPFQRLRNIHQLALTYQVYPGATHRRFEHSLGVMGVATRVFETVLAEENLANEVRVRIATELQPKKKDYWRSVVRLAALLHDVGHLPFSHAAEKDLLPPGWDHERMTAEIIRNSDIAEILRNERPSVDPEDVIDVCYDVSKRTDKTVDPWRSLLNEFITGNTFGADRIDYLLRDSLHSGVSYGRFDPERLISSLRLLVDPDSDNIAVGLDHGGMHSAEALLLARYFMYTQVYFHDVRRIYDLHLKEFLAAWLEDGRFPTDWSKLLTYTDNEVLAAMRHAQEGEAGLLRDLAIRTAGRKHFRTAFSLTITDSVARPDLFEKMWDHAKSKFGPDNVRRDSYVGKSEANVFPIVMDDGTIRSSAKESGVAAIIPPVQIGFIFVRPDLAERAATVLGAYRSDLTEGKI